MNERNRAGRRAQTRNFNACNPKNLELNSGKPINTKSKKDRKRCYNLKVDCTCIFCNKSVAMAKINGNGLINAFFICPECEEMESNFIQHYALDKEQRLPNGCLLVNSKHTDLCNAILQYTQALIEFNK